MMGISWTVSLIYPWCIQLLTEMELIGGFFTFCGIDIDCEIVREDTLYGVEEDAIMDPLDTSHHKLYSTPPDNLTSASRSIMLPEV